MKTKKILVIILLTFVPHLVSASTGYTASGFDPGAYNGEYCDAGQTEDGQPSYTNGAKFLYQTFQTYHYTTLSGINGDNSNDFYINNPNPATTGNVDPGPDTLNAISWQVAGSGVTAGTFTQTNGCGAGGGGASSTPDTSPTSTPDQVQQNIYNGVVLMFMTFGVLYLIVKK